MTSAYILRGALGTPLEPLKLLDLVLQFGDEQICALLEQVGLHGILPRSVLQDLDRLLRVFGDDLLLLPYNVNNDLQLVDNVAYLAL